MKRYQTVCLIFVGLCLAIAASHASIGWWRCTFNNGGMTCRSLQSDAVAAWSMAGNVLQGIMFQTNPPGP